MIWLSLISSIFLIGLSIIVCFESVKLGIGELHNPGSGFMAFFCSCVLFFLALTVLVKDFIGTSKGKDREPRTVLGNLQKPTFLVLALFGYTFLLRFLGYIVTTFLLVSLMLCIFDPNRKKWWRYFIIGAIAANLSFAIFCKWLQVQFPIGIFRIGF